METPKTYEYDCTKKCRNPEHGNKITLALTKRNIADEKMAAFIGKTCANFCDICDDLGRSAVHMAASIGRYAILEWLLNQGAIINGQDSESGSSPLHRAIFYGSIDCAVLLLKWGASLDLQDFDTCCPLKHICRICDMKFYDKLVNSSNELLVWGSNKNYNLGSNNDETTTSPQHLDFFRKEHISIELVALGTYHSLFLDKRGYLYSVGHGKGGRLGTGNESSLPTPKKIKVPIKNPNESIQSISVSLKHSLVLTSGSLVFATGLNEDHQLGVRDCGEKLAVFKEVLTLRDFGVEGLIKVIARDQYSLTYSETCIYVWGTNLGQFGMDTNIKTIPVPKLMKLPPRTTIQFVVANNTAIVIYTKENLVLVYYNYKMRSLKTPNFEIIKSISIVGGDVSKSSKGSATALKLLILTQTNALFFWYELSQTFLRSSFANIRLAEVDKILYKSNQVLILSSRDVYKGKCQQIPLPIIDENKKKSSATDDLWSSIDKNQTEISKEHMIRIDLQRVPNIDRVVDIFCNDDFSSYAVLQESYLKYFKAPTLTAEEYSFKKLYHDVSQMDAVHDIVFHVENEVFPAHKFIVYSRAPALEELVNIYNDKDIYLNFQGLTSKMFEFIMKFIYTNYLPNEEDLEDIRLSLGEDSPNELKDVCQLLLNVVEKFQVNNLANYLKMHLEKDPFFLPHIPDKTKYRFKRLKSSDRPDLYDVKIISAGDLEFQAHKCVLVARLEFFAMMFSHTWAERSTISLNVVPHEYLVPIIDFLYTGDVEGFRKQNFSETYLYNMIVYCDQFFIERLRKVCEILILDKITVRKCGEMLDFATLYNCSLLKSGCHEFISQNLQRVLTFRTLENCEPESLAGINSHYRNMFKDIFDYRMITPDSEAIEDELLLSFVDDFYVDLNYKMETDEEESKKNITSLKGKAKENKTKQDLRQYEREAITTMMEKISLSEKLKSSESLKPSKESTEKDEKSNEETKTWMKVVDKKEQKKKVSLENSVKVNAILQQEEKQQLEFVPLKRRQGDSPEKEQEQTLSSRPDHITSSTPHKAYNLNLSDFTPVREKLSQKQRKRLSSENSNVLNSWRSPPANATPSPSQPVAIPNAWGLTPPEATSISFDDPTPATGTSYDPTSFANMARKSLKSKSNTGKYSTSPAANKSFSQILDEEKKDKEYFERMKTKSLALTQIEETAITELRAFYNADNTTDELITIERVQRPQTNNFAVWQKS